MSIRLRLSLIYSLLLAITMAIFGGVVYTIQARYSMDWLRKDILVSSATLNQSIQRIYRAPRPPERDGQQPPPPDGNAQQPQPPLNPRAIAQDETFSQQAESEIVRVLDPDGGLIGSPYGRPESVLPLSAEGLQALRRGRDWWVEDEVDGRHLLIYHHAIENEGRIFSILQIARPLTERDRSLKMLAGTLVGASIIICLAAFGAGWLLAGIALRPIQRITATAQTIGREQDFTRRVEYAGPADEVGALALTFNAMLAQLQEVYQKVTRALEMQRSFVADVSHELRTPLTTLRGNLGLLGRKPPLPDEEQADILHDMVEESDRLIRLVNDLLVLARADAGRSLTREPVDLRPLLEEVCRQARLLASDRLLRLADGPQITLLGERDAVKQVLLILLDNALKHTVGEITLTAEMENGQAHLRVLDEGPGISAETLAHVFDRFYRGEDRLLIPGSGLGLPIARSLVESLGGTVTLESDPARGSVVTLILPVKSARAGPKGG